MKYLLPDIKEINIRGKRVFLRSDLDAPLSQRSTIEDDTRLVASLPTLQYLLKHGAKVILAGHLRRPNGYDPKLSLLPVAKWIHDKFKVQSFLRSRIQLRRTKFKVEKTKIDSFEGWKLAENLFLLENLRFHKEEKENDPEFAKKLSSLADIYVNDAFASSHRKHASIVGVPKLLPHFAGIRLQKEIKVLLEVLENPKRPLVVLIGGAKIETKLPLVQKMHKFADYVLVGGRIANETRILLKVQHEKINPPAGGRKSVLQVAELRDDEKDITPKSTENFLQIINLAKTVVWNGPVGKTESSGIEGSKKLAEGILKNKAYSIVGGGDTLEFLKKMNILDKFSFFSTGGGAMLAFLSGEKLPGIEALLFSS